MKDGQIRYNVVLYPSMNLRFVERDVQMTIDSKNVLQRRKILQQQFFSTTTPDIEWRDVPLEVEK